MRYSAGRMLTAAGSELCSKFCRQNLSLGDQKLTWLFFQVCETPRAVGEYCFHSCFKFPQTLTIVSIPLCEQINFIVFPYMTDGFLLTNIILSADIFRNYLSLISPWPSLPIRCAQKSLRRRLNRGRNNAYLLEFLHSFEPAQRLFKSPRGFYGHSARRFVASAKIITTSFNIR